MITYVYIKYNHICIYKCIKTYVIHLHHKKQYYALCQFDTKHLIKNMIFLNYEFFLLETLILN